MRRHDTVHNEIVVQNILKDSFSIVEINPGGYYPIERLRYNQLLIVTSGKGKITIDDKMFDISGNDIFLASKGQLYSRDYKPLTQGYEITFGDCFWDRAPQSSNDCKSALFNDTYSNSHMVFDEGTLDSLKDILKTMQSEFISKCYINKLDALAAYLKILMIKVANLRDALREGAFDSYENQLYRTFLSSVIADSRRKKSVFAYAEELAVSPRRLSESCKKCSGKGAKEIIDNHIIAEAKRLLQFSAMPIKAIGYHLGFLSAVQFSHFFKNKELLSPEIYRSRYVNTDI